MFGYAGLKNSQPVALDAQVLTGIKRENMQEQWKRIKGFLNYEISNHGRVRRTTENKFGHNLDSKKSGFILKALKDKFGYRKVWKSVS